jgi:hypothetical protein
MLNSPRELSDRTIYSNDELAREIEYLVRMTSPQRCIDALADNIRKMTGRTARARKAPMVGSKYATWEEIVKLLEISSSLTLNLPEIHKHK